MRKVMAVLLVIVGCAGFMFGVNFMSVSLSAVHEIEALLCFLIGTVGIAGGVIASGIEDLVTMRRAEMLARAAAPQPKP